MPFRLCQLPYGDSACVERSSGTTPFTGPSTGEDLCRPIQIAGLALAMVSALNATPSVASEAAYEVTNLVSDGSVSAAFIDANLVNPWGIAFNPNGFVWIANNHSGTSTLYSGSGQPAPPPPQTALIVSIPGGAPTGLVYNGTQDFKVNGQTSPFIFSSETGVISAWSPAVNLNNAQQVATRAGAVYKGLALAANGTENFLYATDFHNGRIDVFDANFHDALAMGKLKCAFNVDTPRRFAPFGIQNINGDLFVTYAKQDKDAEDDVAGAGLGLIIVFDADGCVIRRFAGGWPLNAPWGITLAPASFGEFGGLLLVSNFGDGTINAFHPRNGAFAGTLRGNNGRPIRIDGLWGLRFGNGIFDQSADSLFFTVGPGDEAHGLYGRIDPSPRRHR